MSNGRHAGSPVAGPNYFLALVIGIPSVLTGVALLVAAVAEAFQYKPYTNPGPLTAAVWLGISGALLAGVPVLVAVLSGARVAHRHYAAWKQTLTPEQRFAVNAAELAAMTGAHLALREHHKRVSERLTASVVGDAGKYDYLMTPSGAQPPE